MRLAALACRTPRGFTPRATRMAISTMVQYPGVGLPLRHFLQIPKEEGETFFRMGAHKTCVGAETPMLPFREVAMLLLMDRLTDKPNWHEKVFDDAIVAKWRQEALTQPEESLRAAVLMDKAAATDLEGTPIPKRHRTVSQRTFDYCIAELRCKAAFFKDTGLTYTLNSGQNVIVKSDTVVSASFHESLKGAFEKLRAEQADEPDWHPGSNDMVQDLVHPSMYPFVYEYSKFIQEEVVGVSDAVENWAHKGETVQKDGRAPEESRPGQPYSTTSFIPNDFWSETYQWLPANLAFQDDGTVKFTSYVNNLHPTKHLEIYSDIERLVDASIPAWDHVLNGSAQTNKSGAEQVRFSPLSEGNFEGLTYDRDEAGVWEKLDEDVLAAYERENGEIEPEDYVLEELQYEHEDDGPEALEAINRQAKWVSIRETIHPEPEIFKPVEYVCEQSIREKFKDSGLQVIVKMASIELTPEKPDFPAGGWHVEGQLNERIVATALYYVDCENVTSSSLSFRMQTDSDQHEMMSHCGQEGVEYYAQVYGTGLRDFATMDAPAIQNFGSVDTCQGRLLAFPNVYQHRVSGFSLQDRTKPGHRRFIALWLVDPHQRLISTANVAPQQLNWWAEAVFGKGPNASTGDMPPELFQVLAEQGAVEKLNLPQAVTDRATRSSRLPNEVMDMIRRHRTVPDGLMTLAEARNHRLMLMKERSKFQEITRDEWHSAGYSFCEH